MLRAPYETPVVVLIDEEWHQAKLIYTNEWIDEDWIYFYKDKRLFVVKAEDYDYIMIEDLKLYLDTYNLGARMLEQLKWLAISAMGVPYE